MNGTQNLIIDTRPFLDCIRSIENFGGTVYQNICTGSKSYVELGSVDWLSRIIFFFFTGVAFYVLWKAFGDTKN